MRALLLPLALVLSACSLAPVLVKPDSPLPSAYPITLDFDAQAHTADLRWRTMFGRSVAAETDRVGVAEHCDLRPAALNVDAMRAQYGIQCASQLPAIDVTGTAMRERTAAGTDLQEPLSSGVQKQYALNIGASAFEVDLFGRLRSLSASEFARYLASNESRRSAQISLVGAVADAYSAERLAEEQLQLARHTLVGWQQSLDLAHRLWAANQNSGLNVAQAEGQAASAEADVEARIRELARAGNALQLLIGCKLPADLPAALPLDRQPVVIALPAGLPSELLIRRPDIRQAEQNLVAANADIGAARAAFFPAVADRFDGIGQCCHE